MVRPAPTRAPTGDIRGTLLRDTLVEEYQGYVHAIVRRMMRSMGLPNRLYDEFVSAGYLGLVEAAQRFDPAQGAKFKAFAALRIRGAVIDGIRSNSQLHGRAYRYAKALYAAHNLRTESPLESSLDAPARSPGAERIVTVLEYASTAALTFRLSMDEPNIEGELAATRPVPRPDEPLDRREERETLRALVDELPEKERGIIIDYYFNERPFSAIAARNASLSKSWVSRLHRRALLLLRQSYEIRKPASR